MFTVTNFSKFSDKYVFMLY